MLRRAILALLLGAAAALVAVAPARADGVVYIVTGTGDGAGACGPYPGVPGFFACTTLRAAVDGSGSDDAIGLPSGTYTLSQGALSLTKSTNLIGGNAHDTVIQGGGTDRVISVGAGVDVGISGVTISGGRAPGANGGNILNAGSLVLFNVRVTGGGAATGAGIGTTGTVQIVSSLIDGNTATGPGGGISASNASVTISDATIFDNHASVAAGISASGGGLSLTHVTVAYNNVGTGTQNPGGLGITGGTWTASGSLFVGNTPSNCGTQASSGTGSIEDGAGCGFDASGITGTGLSSALSDQGGHTPVLTIPATSLAKGFVSPCDDAFDQRLAQRNVSGACDAGAFEEGAVAPPVTGFQLPVPPAQPPPPPPPPPPSVATPVPQQSVAGQVVSGKVRVRKPGSNDFVDLDPTQPIPVGSTVDTKQGQVKITALLKQGGKPDTANFYDGIFKIGQSKTTTDLTLSESLAPCAKAKARSAAKKPKSRKLWGNGSGSFRTRGQY
ncbi:MAG TPA: choice-of-anchor Q domain-containing protein, partial [Baekduia sp.]